MIDSTLTARLNALEKNLEHAANPKDWKSKLILEKVRVDANVWSGLDMTIGTPARKLVKDIKNIREKLKQAEEKANQGEVATANKDLEKIWKEYAAAYRQGQEIFRECLEFLGGLVLRDRWLELDNEIGRVADELIRACGESISKVPTMTIPAPQEVLTKTMVRIIRMRFPEWTIWTLPFTAHEYGHVVIDEIEGIRNFAEEEGAKWTAQDIELTSQIDKEKIDKERAKRRSEYYLREFLADSFATYTMGPAYACAAIFLRFNPSSDFAEDEGHLKDATRSHVILNMLRCMNKAGDESPYEGVIENLEAEWKRMLVRSGQTDTITVQDDQRLKTLEKAIWEKFDEEILPASYNRQEYGWNTAQDWEKKWRKDLKDLDNGKLSIPEPTSGELRDVLNAAWLCRINIKSDDNEKMSTEKIKMITTAALELCNKIIIEKQSRASSGGAPSGGR